MNGDAEFGATPWGHEWRRIAEPTTLTRPDPSLPRARTLARGDGVVELDPAPGRVHAVVVDRSRHDVTLSFPVWTASERERAAPLLAGVTAAGDVADDRQRTVRVAPTPDGLEATCGCTARRRPCPHVLAVALAVARRVDERPVLALRLRGVEPGSGVGADPPTRIPLTALDPSGFWGDDAEVT